jgi:transposase
MQIREITDAQGQVREPHWLTRAESVHRQLRPQLMTDYAQELARVFAGGGRMVVAADGQTVIGLAVWRVLAKTYARREYFRAGLFITSFHFVRTLT